MTWLKECSPDIVCLQEIKCVDEAFPRLELESLGYNVVTHGQKTFNGVALLSKLPFDETKSGLAGDDEDAHARFLEGVVTLKHGVMRVACLYCPMATRPTATNIHINSNGMSRLEYSKSPHTEEPGPRGRFQRHPGARDVRNPAAPGHDALPARPPAVSSPCSASAWTDACAVNDEANWHTF